MQLVLDERKNIILKAVIKSYLETGEPVGSRAISRMAGMNLSSATIRNEMSDLVEMGYLDQPHTSAGRVPTDKGYRFYVDAIMDEYSESLNLVTRQMGRRIDRLEQLLKSLVKMIAADTDYAALISGPSLDTTRIKYIQLSVSGSRELLLILVLDGNVIKNEILKTSSDVSLETAINVTVMINNYLSGLSLKDITPRLITTIMLKAGEKREIAKLVLDATVEILENGASDRDIFTSGAKNLFKYPEIASSDKAGEVVSIFEEKDVLKGMVNELAAPHPVKGAHPAITRPARKGNVRVYLGGEGPVKDMKDYSLITANYELGDGLKGVIGVIGPKRMNYEKVVRTLNNLESELNIAFMADEADVAGEADGVSEAFKVDGVSGAGEADEAESKVLSLPLKRAGKKTTKRTKDK